MSLGRKLLVCSAGLLALLFPGAIYGQRTLPRSVSLIADFQNFDFAPQVQGKRDTCSLFVITALAEFECARQSPQAHERLSEEFLIWAGNEASGLKDDQAMEFLLRPRRSRSHHCEVSSGASNIRVAQSEDLRDCEPCFAEGYSRFLSSRSIGIARPHTAGRKDLLGRGHSACIIRRMTPQDVLRAATKAEIGGEIISLVPHWYEAECGPERYSIPIGESAAPFHDQGQLSANLTSLLASISARTRELPLDRFVEYPGLTDILLESFVIEWLRMHSREADWRRLIKYLETVSRRTNENLPVALTLVIQPGLGRGDITQPHLQKFFDRLASSPVTFTYLAVDPALRLIHYGSVEWSQVNDAESCKFYPEFLHPIHSVITDTDLVAHLTPRGDLVIMNKAGVLATKRKRRWKIYDLQSFNNSLANCLGNPHLGANLLEVVFDLSFRRQGALLIYDPEHRIQERILNPESILLPHGNQNGRVEPGDECGQALIGRSIEGFAMGKETGSLKRKRQLIELACLDGAVVFDDDELLAVGALVRSHPSVGNQMGARKTAARSSYLWGAHPIEVSSDGDVTVYFKSRSGDQECDAVMHFL